MLHSDEKIMERLGENIARGMHLRNSNGKKAALRSLEHAAAAVFESCRRLEAEFSADTAPAGVLCALDELWLVRQETRKGAFALRGVKHVRTSDGEAVTDLVCRAMVRAQDGGFCLEDAKSFLRGFQRVVVLELDELGLLGEGLCCALTEEFARECLNFPRQDRINRIANALREVSSQAGRELMHAADLAGHVLEQDPSGVFAQMDERSRACCRAELERVARRSGMSALRAAKRILELARSSTGVGRHIGFWIFTRPLGRRKAQANGLGYILANVLLAVLLSLLAGAATGSGICAALALVPASELVKAAADAVCRRFARPVRVLRLELASGVPKQGSTVCVISALLTGPESARRLAQRLELFRLAERGSGANLRFGLLADLPESRSAQRKGDCEALSAAESAVRELNEKYGGGFYLFCRERSYDARDGVFRGYERKRGAITELARLLCSRESALRVICGDAEALFGTRYILTLDEDTVPAPGAARELIGAMLHPLNRPVADSRSRVVKRGYGILQPRMSTALMDGGSLFARLFAGAGGCDPYGGTAPDLYMDFFGSSNFSGKGIIDAQVYLQCTEDRFPQGRILSHDAPESACLRAGFMGDVEFTDTFPQTAAEMYKRQERWTRGDWQNLPWLFRAGRGFAPIARWRMFDSLRRSLVPVALTVSLLAASYFPGVVPAAILSLCCVALPVLTALWRSLVHGGVRERYSLFVPHGVSGALLKAAAGLMMLPFEALSCAAGATLALWRMCVSHKRLLAWETAAQSGAHGGKVHRAGCAAAVVTASLCAASGNIFGFALGLVWAAGPLFVHVSGPVNREKECIPPRDRRFLLECAQDIWRWFDLFCRESDNFLPPDNYRAVAPAGTAHRTSPTNIGLYLTCCVCAAELGLEDTESALQRIERALHSLERLPKLDGQPYNWYDTRTLEVLEPRYVSTVDSGNLAAGLITLSSWLEEKDCARLRASCERLLGGMDFSPLYDEKEELFSIGKRENGQPDKGHYDLYSSEARLTSFIACARGDVPARHWGALSRAVVQCRGYRGSVSWSGSVFEYLMPEIFLPLFRGSLQWETALFCLAQQRLKTAQSGVWGCSESAHLARDGSFGYRAQGCASLALCRGMDERRVFSPYSSFLALRADPEAACRNLRRFEKAGMRCRFGFWEALDETPEDPELAPGAVRCVMAHHLGMSLASIANALADGLCVRLFMQRRENAAFRSLLEERAPVGRSPVRAGGGESLRTAAEQSARGRDGDAASPLPDTV